ncbi:breast cancer type 2 susceptibility protein [Megachile rotundata]|uniref:breast cancer type 2 susceptibility protein n=1 Tax=Megachile rotundata TaxID=143995 RepID=UPI003FD5DB3C
MDIDNKNEGFSFGFTTASGSAINVSEKALLKAKNLFIEELKETSSHEEVSKVETNINESHVQLSNVGFQTASGKSINVTNEALLKAETLLSSEMTENAQNIRPSINYKTARCNLDTIFDEDLVKVEQQSESTMKKESNKDNAFIINNGFKTASGKRLKVTEQALQKAHAMLSESIIESTDNTCSNALKIDNDNLHNIMKHKSLSTRITEKFKETCASEKDTVKHELQNIEFQTASGQSINVTKEALLKSNALFSEDMMEDLEKSPPLTKSLPKRKIKDVDNDEMSFNKVKSTNHFKKLRFSNEFQVQTPICNNSINAEEKENQNVTSVPSKVLILDCDANKSINNNQITETNENNIEGNNKSLNSLISHEIEASTVALLADEKDAFDEWVTPVKSKESEDTLNVPSSPVIGGQFIPKKRKNVNNKRKSTNAVKNMENKHLCANTINQLNDDCVNSNDFINKCTIKKEESMNKTNTCDIAVTNEFNDTQLMLEFINQSEDILEKRFQATLEQDKQIILKERCKPKPIIGTLYLYRKTNNKNRLSWKEISKGNKPVLCTSKELTERKLPLEILDITAHNAITFKFRCTDFYGQDVVQNNIEGIKLEDGAYLILDENGYVGITEIKRSFLASPGVDPSLLCDGWVENHYKWIVWKLASMDRIKIGSITLPRALTPARVMMELKYRYDREIDRSQRSAIRKILEKDDVASKRMVLCVESITGHDDCAIINGSLLKAPKKVMVTDGWYSIQADIDYAMVTNIISGKVKEGTKLVTYGSELLNCEQGCSPLEVPSNVCLKLHTNSTRRARWDTRLGYIVPSGPLCIKLRTVNPNGGLIGKIKVLITRVYPMLYREKTSTGESITRNARCEEKANIAYEKKCRSTIEAFYAKAEKCFSSGAKKRSLDADSPDLATIDWSEDCGREELEQLKDRYRVKEEQFRQKLESQLQEILPAPRQVTPLLKVRVFEEDTNAVLTIWSPSEEIVDILKEGNFISVCNIVPLGKRNNELQLSASRSTVFKQINVSNISYPKRTYTPLCDVNKPTFAPIFGELDTVGIIVSIGNEPYGMKHFEAVYLAYPDANSQSSYISILFWHGIDSHGYSEILTVGSFIACSNLEWRRATMWRIPMTYCTERSTFTRNPRQNYLQQPFEDLKHLIKDTSTYITTCAKEISKEVQKKPVTRMSDSHIQYKSNENLSFDKKYINDVSQEHTRCLLSNQSGKPITVQERLEKLKHYGEPSSLSPIVLNNSSKRVFLEFQSPVRSTDKEQAKSHRLSNKKFTQDSR